MSNQLKGSVKKQQIESFTNSQKPKKKAFNIDQIDAAQTDIYDHTQSFFNSTEKPSYDNDQES